MATNDAFFEGMRRYGFVEGQNLLDDPNGYELRTEQFAGHASEIVKQGVDLIVCVGDDAIRAAQQATKIIPILAGTEDMLGSGFAHSMAKPEGNTTGHSILSFELNGKRQEILMELLPAARHMAALTDTNTYSPEHLQTLQELTRQRGVELSVYRVSKPEEIAGAIEAAPSGKVTTLGKRGATANGCYHCASDDRADARNGHQLPAALGTVCQLFDLFSDVFNTLIEPPPIATEILNNPDDTG